MGLHRLSDDEMKQLVLEIGFEHILGEEEYTNIVIEGLEHILAENECNNMKIKASSTDYQNFMLSYNEIVIPRNFVNKVLEIPEIK